MTPDQAAIGAVEEFIRCFNAQDHDGLAASLNYPHVRLALGRFVTIDSAEAFAKLSAKGTARLEEEGWHHTVIAAIECVHSAPDKGHVALTMERCHEDGSVYNTFDTFWVATLKDGHWGIQFRSSFLR